MMSTLPVPQSVVTNLRTSRWSRHRLNGKGRWIGSPSEVAKSDADAWVRSGARGKLLIFPPMLVHLSIARKFSHPRPRLQEVGDYAGPAPLGAVGATPT